MNAMRWALVAMAATGVVIPGALRPSLAEANAKLSSLESKLQGVAAPYPTVLRPQRPRALPSFGLRLMAANMTSPTSAAALRGTVVIGLARAEDAEAVLREYSITAGVLEPTLRALQATVDAGSAVKLAEGAEADSRIRYVEPLRDRALDHQRNDPLTYLIDPETGWAYQWSFRQVGTDRALNVAAGDPRTLVGIIDSGVDETPDLRGKIAELWYYPSQSPDTADRDGHGTFIASTIAAVNDDGFGLAGFCGACRLIIFKDLELTAFSTAGAIRRLTDQGVRVINASYSGAYPSFVEIDAVSYAIDRGVLIVAAAGNESSPLIGYPAGYVQPLNGVLGYGLAVGSSDGGGGLAWFSNWGARLSLLAPGTLDGSCETGVFAAMPSAPVTADGSCGRMHIDFATGGRYRYGNGTSYSAPIVAGIAALLWSERPDLPNYQVAWILQHTADRDESAEWDPFRGWGVIDASAALEYATGRSTADVVRLGALTRSREPRPGRVFSVRTLAHWQDGTPLNRGFTSCTARLRGRALYVQSATFSAARAGCTWRLPSNAASGARVTGNIRVEDENGNLDQRSFSFAVPKRKR